MNKHTKPVENVGLDLSVSVIIPFYQRQPGLLLAAVRSVLAQQSTALSVIVVDDGSPVSATNELAGLSEPERRKVTIIEQRNAGPGAARNRGLDALSDHTDVVAFLDSDDQWVPDHLTNALAAFAAEADFYFSDYVPLGHKASMFEQCGLTTAAGQTLETGQALYRYTLNLFDALLLRPPLAPRPWLIVALSDRTSGSGLIFPMVKTSFSGWKSRNGRL